MIITHDFAFYWGELNGCFVRIMLYNLSSFKAIHSGMALKRVKNDALIFFPYRSPDLNTV